MFIKIDDNNKPVGHPVADDNLRLLIPSNVSIPQYPLTKDVLPFGYAVYEFAQKPELAPFELKVVEEGEPEWTTDELRGQYITQVWNVRDMTAPEVEAVNQQKLAIVRSERNARLSQYDWTQLGDVPLTAQCKADFADYRQALRDVDLSNPVWPEVPAEVWVA
jgi:hypothetical protein